MATSEEHFVSYGRLRARMLAQHFAYSRHQRVNFLSLWNWLLDPASGLGENAAQEDELKRWNVIVHGRENPLAYSAHLLACLSVEHALGHDKARPIIELALDAFGELYKFDGEFAGYPTRWDAQTSAQDEGLAPLDRADDFLVGRDDEYLYSVPATDPRHVPLRTPEALRARRPASPPAREAPAGSGARLRREGEPAPTPQRRASRLHPGDGTSSNLGESAGARHRRRLLGARCSRSGSAEVRRAKGRGCQYAA